MLHLVNIMGTLQNCAFGFLSSPSLAAGRTMNPRPRFPDLLDDDVPRELIELGKRIATLPEELYAGFNEPFVQTVEATRRRKRVLSLVQETLSQLRLDVKYLLFDLEVTRRERDELRRQVDEMQAGDAGF